MSTYLIRPRLVPLARRRRNARVKLIISIALVGSFIVAPYVFATYLDPYTTNVGQTLTGPSAQHWFGTDKVGTDIFSRTLWAARMDLPLALGSTAMALAIGAPLGAWFGYSTKLGERMMRVIDAFQALPLLIIILALVALSGGKTYMVAVAIVIYAAPAFIRVVRSEVLSVSTSRYVEAARAFGVSTPRILTRHVLRNVAEIILAQTALIAAMSFLAIAALSFLGVGVAPPTPTWGGMVADGLGPLVTGIWWPVIFPGAAIFLNVVAFNAMANATREIGWGPA